MSETRNIVVVGGSHAGLGVAHSFLKHNYQSLKTAQPSVSYQVHLIDPSSHYWWRICAPRASVSVSDFPHDKTFFPIADGFKQYPSDAFVFHQGKATSVNIDSRTIAIQLTTSGASETIPYHALVIATGSNTPTPMTSLHGDHHKSEAAIDAMNKRMATAKSVIIGGGGPVAVETAGEFGEKYNGALGWFGSKAEPEVKITLVTSADKLLPVLSKGQSNKAEKFLNRVGVTVMYNTRVEKADLSSFDTELIDAKNNPMYTSSGGDRSVVHLSNGEKLEADVYVPAIGAVPNTQFLPSDLLTDKGFVKTSKDLRVEGAGPRVYVCGDAANNTAGGMMSLYSAVPVAAANLANDLAEKDGSEAPTRSAKDKQFTFDMKETQMVPVGKSKGVASMMGYSLPSAAAWAIKGRDYMLWGAKPIVSGSKW